jgi:hypothetical protein
MKTFKQLISEISTRSMSKYVKLAEPNAKAQGAIGSLTNDQEKQNKADKRLKQVSKVKNKLDTIKPAYESEEENNTPDNE